MGRQTIHVLSRRAPTLLWRCPRCHEATVFECSEAFRANANGKVVDVWLIYRCRRCDVSRNLTVVERRPVHGLPTGLLDAAQRNDPQAARRCARDLGLIRRSGASIHEGDAWEPESFDRSMWHLDGELELIIEFAEPLLIRLDDVLTEALAISRSRLKKLRASRVVILDEPGRTDTLRVWGGVSITISASALVAP